MEQVSKKYGNHYIEELYQEDDLRGPDYNGHNVFYNFSFEELGELIYHEP